MIPAKINKIIIILFILFIIPAQLYADQIGSDDKQTESKFASSLGLSYVTASGNSHTQTLSIEADAALKTEKSELEFKAGTVYGKSEGEKTTDYWHTSAKYKYNLTAKMYVFLFTGYEGNKIAGYKTRLSVQPGVGYRFLDGRHELLGELSPGYVHEDRLANENLSYASGVANIYYKFHITKKALFAQDIEYIHDFSDSENYRANSETALHFSISDLISFKTSVKVHYVNLPPEAAKRTDTFTSTSLVFTF